MGGDCLLEHYPPTHYLVKPVKTTGLTIVHYERCRQYMTETNGGITTVQVRNRMSTRFYDIKFANKFVRS